jgi:protease YdgD
MIRRTIALALIASMLSGRAEASETDAAFFEASVGKLNVSGVGSCTAVLVAPNLALTAAHCLYNKRARRWVHPSLVHLLLGYSRGDFVFHSRAAGYIHGEHGEGSHASSSDWAIVRLEQTPPEPFVPLLLLSATASEKYAARLAGYGRPRLHLLDSSQECSVRLEGALLVGNCPANLGMSGGPIVDQSTGRLIGSLSGNAKVGDMNVLVGVPVTEWLSDKRVDALSK